jgi:hypothetical protein
LRVAAHGPCTERSNIAAASSKAIGVKSAVLLRRYFVQRTFAETLKQNRIKSPPRRRLANPCGRTRNPRPRAIHLHNRVYGSGLGPPDSESVAVVSSDDPNRTPLFRGLSEPHIKHMFTPSRVTCVDNDHNQREFQLTIRSSPSMTNTNPRPILDDTETVCPT